ncbi:unnamed protein product [Prorocentrum cordatum]|uniref:Uncharacterized protein n=1 Tax=Prorocentrum cordatum TaxID=2364126 RepID=A0ABN9UST7_9DINO|nr:unnamed protein product [Polarella glacialis]
MYELCQEHKVRALELGMQQEFLTPPHIRAPARQRVEAAGGLVPRASGDADAPAMPVSQRRLADELEESRRRGEALERQLRVAASEAFAAQAALECCAAHAAGQPPEPAEQAGARGSAESDAAALARALVLSEDALRLSLGGRGEPPPRQDGELSPASPWRVPGAAGGTDELLEAERPPRARGCDALAGARRRGEELTRELAALQEALRGGARCQSQA